MSASIATLKAVRKISDQRSPAVARLVPFVVAAMYDERLTTCGEHYPPRPVTAAELAETLQWDPQSAYRALRTAADLGLVQSSSFVVRLDDDENGDPIVRRRTGFYPAD